MCLHFFVDRNFLNDRDMERRKVIVELSVLTMRHTDRDIERDIDRVVLPLRNIESGQTTVEDVEVKDVR